MTKTGSDGKISRPVRARELQDPLNHYLYHPLAWQLARRLAHTPLTPNMVSVIGALCVIGAAVAYAQPGWPGPALLGLVLHMTWHVVDGADGDLARITGKSSPTGELVDGLCDYLSHIVLYFVLGWLLDQQMGWTAWLFMVPAGLSHIVQSNHVEVQRRQYQWWVYGTPWLRNTAKGDSATGKGGLGAIVGAYLELASGMTPHALRIDAAVEAAKGDPARQEAIRAAVRAEAPPLLLMCKFLGPNPRALVLGASMLLGSPIWYFLYQAVVLNLLLVVSVKMHNAAARRIAAEIGA
ncbi:CDP-alcohol phosphatidyltransferase family protein [Novosphingobium sp. JCM 18896]|uniref:CDP-alcohol phosphatidyltransferase family protein n=1 Tax=Novosphingobium sp. JCM 18896 TaxID=2989731 RepID=UPI002221E64F|nr:CDP-alcohol phosphatidyltransferase family protein [Novosphingobium sp. JCM 18896]MCW1429413.1 CDP-alcohol phosphatidyltransferase family protein [Novosphingobium sp. JCM 18896]